MNPRESVTSRSVVLLLLLLSAGGIAAAAQAVDLVLSPAGPFTDDRIEIVAQGPEAQNPAAGIRWWLDDQPLSASRGPGLDLDPLAAGVHTVKVEVIPPGGTPSRGSLRFEVRPREVPPCICERAYLKDELSVSGPVVRFYVEFHNPGSDAAECEAPLWIDDVLRTKGKVRVPGGQRQTLGLNVDRQWVTLGARVRIDDCAPFLVDTPGPSDLLCTNVSLRDDLAVSGPLVRFYATLENPGTQKLAIDVPVRVDGMLRGSERIVMPPGTVREVAFNIERRWLAPGARVEIDNCPPLTIDRHSPGPTACICSNPFLRDDLATSGPLVRFYADFGNPNVDGLECEVPVWVDGTVRTTERFYLPAGATKLVGFNVERQYASPGARVRIDDCSQEIVLGQAPVTPTECVCTEPRLMDELSTAGPLVRFQATVLNPGNDGVDCEIPVRVDGAIRTREKIYLPAGATRSVAMNVDRQWVRPGSRVKIDACPDLFVDRPVEPGPSACTCTDAYTSDHLSTAGPLMRFYAELTNRSPDGADCVVPLYVDGVERARETVYVPAGASKSLALNVETRWIDPQAPRVRLDDCPEPHIDSIPSDSIPGDGAPGEQTPESPPEPPPPPQPGLGDQNRFEVTGAPGDLEICTFHWEIIKKQVASPSGMGASPYGQVYEGRWSKKCNPFRQIGAVDGHALCTGAVDNNYNAGFLAYSPAGTGKLLFEVYRFDHQQKRGLRRLDRQLDLRGHTLLPGTLEVEDCRSRATVFRWRTADGSLCKARLWKFPKSDPNSSNVFLTGGGLEDLDCIEGGGTPTGGGAGGGGAGGGAPASSCADPWLQGPWWQPSPNLVRVFGFSCVGGMLEGRLLNDSQDGPFPVGDLLFRDFQAAGPKRWTCKYKLYWPKSGQQEWVAANLEADGDELVVQYEWKTDGGGRATGRLSRWTGGPAAGAEDSTSTCGGSPLSGSWLAPETGMVLDFCATSNGVEARVAETNDPDFPPGLLLIRSMQPVTADKWAGQWGGIWEKSRKREWWSAELTLAGDRVDVRLDGPSGVIETHLTRRGGPGGSSPSPGTGSTPGSSPGGSPGSPVPETGPPAPGGVVIEELRYHDSVWPARLREGVLEVQNADPARFHWRNDWVTVGQGVTDFEGVGTNQGPVVAYTAGDGRWRVVLIDIFTGTQKNERTLEEPVSILEARTFGVILKTGERCWDYSWSDLREIYCDTYRYKR